jgi:tRNA(Ile)-lysidine synthase
VSNLSAHVEQSIRTRGLFKRNERILVAVSGGVDSMVLLHLLHALAPKFGWKLAVAHFNHQLRGRASDGDEQFVIRSAKALGLKTVVERGEVKALAEKSGVSIEMAARGLRHAFLARTAGHLRIRTIALAHHADDQVELFFLRLFRGAGGEGIAGMKWRSPSPSDPNIQLARPLLDVSKTELEEFARESKIPFRQDAGNASLDIQRNRIRHELLPLLKARYQPALAKIVLRTMDIIGAEAEFVTDATRQWLKQKRPLPFDRLPRAIQRRCLQAQLLRLNAPADYDVIEQLRASPNRPVSVSPALSLFRDNAGLVQIRTHSTVTFGADQIEIEMEDKAGDALFGGVRCRWRVERVKSGELTASSAGREFFDADKIGPRIVLRHWRAGDRFQPIGMAAPVKLQDWFTNQKIPRARRHELLVAESASGGIFWVEGLRISEDFKLTSRTKRALVWRWQRGKFIHCGQAGSML